jgi:hypothetical protein
MAKNTGKRIESHGQYGIYAWTGPQVESGEMKPYTSSLSGSFDWAHHATLEEARAHVQGARTFREVEVSFKAYVPVEATDEEIEQWIEFELSGGSMPQSNPLSRHAVEARDVQVDL